MKEFRCSRCNIYLGEMSKGKLHIKAVILCSKCMENYKMIEDLNKYTNSSKSNSTPNPDSEDFLNGFFAKNIFNQ